MIKRRAFLKTASAAAACTTIRPIVQGIQLIGRIPVRALTVPAVVSGAVRSLVAIPTAAGVVYFAEMRVAKAIPPLVLPLVGLASAWGLPLIAHFFQRNRSGTQIADVTDSFHDRAGGEFDLVTPSSRTQAPTARTAGGTILTVDSQNGRGVGQHRVFAPYTDLSNDEAFFLQSVAGPLREIAPYTARIPAGSEAQTLWQQAIERTKSTAAVNPDYQRYFANANTERLLVGGRSNDGTRAYLMSPHFG